MAVDKDEFFAQHRAAGHRSPVAAIAGMPPLFARRLSFRELARCYERKENGNEGEIELNVAKYAIACIVTDDGRPFFRSFDQPDLEQLDADGMRPLLAAMNEANASRQCGPEAASSLDAALENHFGVKLKR